METPKLQSPIRGNLALFLILSASALGIFLAPWYVPVSEPAEGQSYTYGFNNHVAILTAGLTLATLFVYLLLRGRKMPEGELERVIKDTFSMGAAGGGDGKLFRSFICAAIIFSFLVAGCYWYSPFDHWGEMGYFISRMELLILGRTPYYGFPFDYGPAMVYVPFHLYRIAHGLFSVEQAYCVILILHWILGLYVLTWCVRLLIPPRRRSIVFWTFAILILNPTLGYQYTPLRYALPIASVLFCHYTILNSEPNRFRGHLGVGLAAALGPFLNFELSPDMGLAVTAALVVYFAGLLRTPERVFAHGAVLALLGAVAAILPWSTAYLSVLTSFGDSLSLPVFPGLGILLFLAAEFFLLPRLAAIGVTSRDANGAACLSLCVLAGILIVPALSRCDIGHVCFNGLATFLFVVAISARAPNVRWFMGALGALLLVFGVLGAWLFLFHYSAQFKAAFAAHSWIRSHPAPAAPAPSHGFFFSKDYPPVEGLEPLLAYGNLAVPLGCSEDIMHFLLLNGRCQIGYNPGNCSDIWMLKQTVRALRDIATYRTILVPKIWFIPEPVPGEIDAMNHRFLRNEELFPVRLVPRHPSFVPERVLAAHISREFSTIGEFRDCLIMVNGAGGAQ